MQTDVDCATGRDDHVTDDLSAHPTVRLDPYLVATGAITTLAGSGEAGLADRAATATMFDKPQRLELSSNGATLFIADYSNSKIRQLDVATGAITTVAECTEPADFAIDPNGAELLVASAQGRLRVKLKTSTMGPIIIPPFPPSTLA